MAAIGKIRSWGPGLVVILGLGLVGFIAQDGFSTCKGQAQVDSSTAGVIDGEKIEIQEFQSLVGEYQELAKLQGQDNLNEDQLNSLRDYVWNECVNNKLVEEQAAKLGLTVTDEEVVNVLKEGTHPAISETPLLSQFVNPQTRAFDANQVSAYREYLKQQSQTNAQAAEQAVLFERCWPVAERILAQKILEMKYQTLLAGCVMSNPVSAKAAFDNQNIESEVIMASMPYASINDNEIEVTDADLKAKYDEMKEQFKTRADLAEIKYVVCQVTASKKDRDALMEVMQKASKALKSDSASVSDVVREAQSQVAYLGLPLSKNALPSDLADSISKMGAGQVTAPFESRDNTFNVVKLFSKENVADSIEFRMISLMGMQSAKATADSIMKSISAGVAFDSIAKKYNQRGEKTWMTSNEYESAPTLTADNKAIYTALLKAPVNEVKDLELSQGHIILQITQRKGNVEKFNVAIVKRAIDFSNETYNETYNKFSQFVSESQNIEGLQAKCADYGYVVMDGQVTNADHTIANIRSSHDAIKWLFTEAEEGHISKVFDRCGDNDRLMVVGLSKLTPKGYLAQSTVEATLKQEVLRDKKFAKLSEQLAGVKSVAEAQAKGARLDSISHITFRAPVYVPSIVMPEPALSGAVAGTEKGAFSKHVVKGQAGAYVFQVINRTQREGVTFNEKVSEAALRQSALQQTVGMAMQELRDKVEIKDNRYIFF
ncbi:SurA N-terminal domain-containing protein [Prevotella sp. E15-22]|uniref:peptidylprolyl isomerase n=1 Tax=Prevotella sp. E15-22 TaxID=2937774 RepID=UPI00205B0EB0|nr:peptidylprolyl isomerase [Prevotella sp. E15-22]UPS45527.1 SurA N-terminal domain-containing protein [Prevotella sp. E15-22]